MAQPRIILRPIIPKQRSERGRNYQLPCRGVGDHDWVPPFFRLSGRIRVPLTGDSISSKDLSILAAITQDVLEVGVPLESLHRPDGCVYNAIKEEASQRKGNRLGLHWSSRVAPKAWKFMKARTFQQRRHQEEEQNQDQDQGREETPAEDSSLSMSQPASTPRDEDENNSIDAATAGASWHDDNNSFDTPNSVSVSLVSSTTLRAVRDGRGTRVSSCSPSPRPGYGEAPGSHPAHVSSYTAASRDRTPSPSPVVPTRPASFSEGPPLRPDEEEESQGATNSDQPAEYGAVSNDESTLCLLRATLNRKRKRTYDLPAIQAMIDEAISSVDERQQIVVNMEQLLQATQKELQDIDSYRGAAHRSLALCAPLRNHSHRNKHTGPSDPWGPLNQVSADMGSRLKTELLQSYEVKERLKSSVAVIEQRTGEAQSDLREAENRLEALKVQFREETAWTNFMSAGKRLANVLEGGDMTRELLAENHADQP